MTAVKIYKRLDPCRCGCQGSDPWHRESYKRVVSAVRDLAAPVRVVIDRGRSVLAVAEGCAQLPWGRTRVVQTNTGNWFVDHEDYLVVSNAPRGGIHD